MRIITGALAFFESSAGDHDEHRRRALAAEPAAGVLADDDDVARLDADPARDGVDRPHRALRRAVHVELAVLPVGHRACASRAADGWCSAPTNVSSRTRSACLKPASTSPTFHSSVCLAERQLAVGRRGEVLRRSTSAPGPCGPAGGGRRLPGCAGGAGAGRTQTLPCVRALGPPGRRLSIGSTTNGSGSYSIWIVSIASAAVSFVHRRDGENRLADVQRLHSSGRAR